MSSTNKVGLILLVLILLSSSCRVPSPKNNTKEFLPALPLISAVNVKLLDQNCSDLVQAHIEAWESREVENLRQIYTDDIVHFDGAPAFVGIDEVLKMAEGMWVNFPNWKMKTGETYISNGKCLGEWINWGIFTFSEDNVAIEYDLFELKDDRINFWRLFYDQKFHDIFFNLEYVEEDYLHRFADIWTNKSLNEMESLYEEQCTVEDTLFGVSLEGSEEISDFIRSFIVQFPDAEWKLLYPFAEDEAGYSLKEAYPFPSQGGVFELTTSDKSGEKCKVRIVLILKLNDDEKITQQETFYDAGSLIKCGLAE